MGLFSIWKRIPRDVQVRVYLADLESKVEHAQQELDELHAEIAFVRRQYERHYPVKERAP